MARIGDFISTDPPRGTFTRMGQKPTRTRRTGRGTPTTDNIDRSPRNTLEAVDFTDFSGSSDSDSGRQPDNNQIGKTINEYTAAVTGSNPKDLLQPLQDAGRGSPSGEVPRPNIPEPVGEVSGDAMAQLQEQIDGASRLGKYASQLKKIIEDPAGQKFLGQMAQAFTARDQNSAGFMLGQSAIDQAEGKMEGEELSRLIEGGDPADARRGIGQESRRAAQTQAFQDRESDRADIGVGQSERQLDQADRRLDQQDERIEIERQRFEQERDALLEEQANDIETMGVSEINLVNEQLAAAYLPDLRKRLENDPRFGPIQELDRYLRDPVTGGVNWVNVYAELQPDERRQFDRMRAEFANQYDPQSGVGIPQMVDAFMSAKDRQQITSGQQTGRPNVDESDMPTLTIDEMEQAEVGVPFIFEGTGSRSGQVFVKNEQGKFVPYTGGQR